MNSSKIEKRISLAKGSAITFLASSVSFVFAIITSVIVARVLGPEGKGIVTLILMIPPILMMVGTMGTEASNVYFTGSRKFKIDDIIGNSLVLAFIFSFIVIAIFFGVYKTSQFQNFMVSNKISPFYLWLGILSLPFNLMYLFFRNILLGKEKIKIMNGLGIFQVASNLLLVLIFIVIFKQGVLGAVLCFTLNSFAVAILSFICVKKLGRISFKLNISLLRESFYYGGKAYLGNLAQFLNYRADIFLVAYFLGPVAVGLYGVAVGLAERLWMIPGSVGIVLFPRISSGDNLYANNVTPKVTRHTFFVVAIMSIGLFLLSKPLLGLLFGQDYLPSAKPLVILLPGVVALSISKVLSSDLAGRGKPQFGMIASFFSLGINIPLNLILIPKWGIVGAAFASSVAYIIATVIVLVAFLKISGNSIKDTLIIKKQEIRVRILLGLKRIRSIFAQTA